MSSYVILEVHFLFCTIKVCVCNDNWAEPYLTPVRDVEPADTTTAHHNAYHDRNKKRGHNHKAGGLKWNCELLYTQLSATAHPLELCTLPLVKRNS